MKKFLFSVMLILTGLSVSAQNKCIVLSSDNSTVDILVDSQDNPTVLLGAGLFADDIERVSGRHPVLKHTPESVSKECVIIGSIEESRFIKELVKKKKIDVSEIKGEWEASLTEVVENPCPGIDKALVIAGSDRRGTVYAVFDISKKIGVSPWYWFADVIPEKKETVLLTQERHVQPAPSVQYRGFFINDEMWGIRPWAQKTFAPQEGKGLGPTTYAKIFEMMLRIKANCLWSALHQQTRPFNCYPENKVVADRYAIVMGTSHPMLRCNIGGAEWDRLYPGQDYNYVTNKKGVYEYWETAAISNGKYENMYTLGKRGKDDVAGEEVDVEVLNQVIRDQRKILKAHVNKNLKKVPQLVHAYREILDLYNQGAKIPDDVIFNWPDDNFGNIRQLPDEKEQKRKGGAGIYYHFQWINGATSAYPWVYTSPLAFTWTEMKKAYDHHVRKFWMVNVGDIKPAEIATEHFMAMAWDISRFQKNEPRKYLVEWAAYTFGAEFAEAIADVFMEHTELGFSRRPEHMIMWNGREKQLQFDWFSIHNYNDEAQRRIDRYEALCKKAEAIYEALPLNRKDAFFEMVLYNIKGAALHNKKVIYAQKSMEYGKEKRASAASYAARAQECEDEIFKLVDHYNTGLLTAGAKWDRMASVPGPWGGQWKQWEMPPVSFYSGDDYPRLNISLEGDRPADLPSISVFNRDKRFIDLYNSGNGCVFWVARDYPDWIRLSSTRGTVWGEERIWIDIDWEKAPKGREVTGEILFDWSSSADDDVVYEELSPEGQQEFRDGVVSYTREEDKFHIRVHVFNPEMQEKAHGFVESNGYISIEAEHFSRKNDGRIAAWEILEGLGRTGNSVTPFPTTVPAITRTADIIKESPSLEYDIYTFTEGKAELTLNCAPSYPVNKNYRLRYAFSIDDGQPAVVDVNSKKDEISNLRAIVTPIDLPAAGQHRLKIWMVDPGLVIDKIILDTGGVQPSYLGPLESKYNK